MKRYLISVLALCGLVNASDDLVHSDGLNEKIDELRGIKEDEFLEIRKSDLIKLIYEIKRVERLNESNKSSVVNFNESLDLIRASGVSVHSMDLRDSSLGTQGR